MTEIYSLTAEISKRNNAFSEWNISSGDKIKLGELYSVVSCILEKKH